MIDSCRGVIIHVGCDGSFICTYMPCTCKCMYVCMYVCVYVYMCVMWMHAFLSMGCRSLASTKVTVSIRLPGGGSESPSLLPIILLNILISMLDLCLLLYVYLSVYLSIYLSKLALYLRAYGSYRSQEPTDQPGRLPDY